ncbi:hypothetical protein [Cellulomonas sp. ATA003]|uniref:hypothetical protein n=1 Tax=Cellulomonas sp. ATA003 TaxID=3073064 RepID=UPI0028734845|nr:hypothetical protein [Cellulomonas sp. ATA003]WNB86357.1 hypothetical protein REH70_03660 [Cellulomonas sp. ATA003]
MHQSTQSRVAAAWRAIAFTVAAVLISVLLPVTAAQAATSRVDLRVLVISNGDVSVEAIAAQMDREGVPYTKVTANPTGRPAIDADFLADAGAGRAKFQGVVLPNQSGGGLPAAERTLSSPTSGPTGSGR